TGLPRTAPLVYGRDGANYVVIGSRAGAPRHPAWYHNLRADRGATIELGTERFEVVCRFALGVERRRLFASYLGQVEGPIAALMQQYELKTSRQFPVVVLEPAE